MFSDKWLHWMVVEYLLSYIQFIDWFFTFSDLYIVSFHLTIYSWYVIGCFTRSFYFVWLLNYDYLISSSLIDYLFPWICLLFPFIWIIVGCMLLAFLREKIALNIFWMIIILYPFIDWFVFLLWSACCFFLIESL